LRAVGFQECLIASPILGAPDTERALEDCSGGGGMWIGHNGRVKRWRVGRRDWTAGDHPLQRIAVLEIHIMKSARERVEPKRGVTHVKARLAPIAVNYLRPH